jgi:hypothetical protein
MGTVLLPGGRIPTLVAGEWYDDGPRDLGGQFQFLQEGSEFRKQLPELEPALLVPKLRELFRPLPLNELTLPLFLGLPEVAQHPRLVVPLLALLSDLSHLPVRLLLRTAEHLADAGDRRAARRLVQGRLDRHQDWACCPEHDAELIGSLARIDPSEALRLLRLTRPRGVRTWQDERTPARLQAAADAYEALGRRKRAQTLRGLTQALAAR